MIRQSDLDAAVSQNILSAKQASTLRAIAKSRVRHLPRTENP